MKKSFFAITGPLCAAAAVLFMAVCSKVSLVDNTGGSGSTTTNGIVAYVYTPQGAPSAGSTWRLRTDSYVTALPAVSDNNSRVLLGSTLDVSGRLAIDSIDSGHYVLEVNNGKGSLVAMRFFAPGNGRTLGLHDTLKPGSRIVGRVPLDMQNGQPWFVQILGLERLAAVDRKTGEFVFPDVPSGTFSLRFACPSAENTPIQIDNVLVKSGDTMLLSTFSAWKYSKKLSLNTTPSGADVGHDVIGFPVLIRLNKDNFDFSQAKKDGADIRFMRPDTTVLFYEIERWDPVTEHAEVWVKLDTVRGNSDSNTITMFWGNANAIAISNGALVFDTAFGYAGVWHLNKNCDDATFHSRNGTPNDIFDTVGAIGHCRHFNGNGYVKIPGLLETPPALTLSAWVYLDTVINTGAEVVSIGDAALMRMDDSWNDKGTQGDYCVAPFTNVDSTHCFTKSGMFLKKTGWHFLAYTVDPAAGVERLFIDGVLSCFTQSALPIVYTGGGSDVYFGKHGNGKTAFNFNGDIDEVRINKNVCTEDWIRLSYMNQRPDDRLVVWQ